MFEFNFLGWKYIIPSNQIIIEFWGDADSTACQTIELFCRGVVYESCQWRIARDYGRAVSDPLVKLDKPAKRMAKWRGQDSGADEASERTRSGLASSRGASEDGG